MVVSTLVAIVLVAFGLRFELSLVVARVALSRIVLLIDDRSDEALLRDVLQRSWSTLPEDSPNAGLDEPRLEIVRCGSSRTRDAATIITSVFTAAARPRLLISR